jgi:uncharacterized protein YndB with AHSA1/START domain
MISPKLDARTDLPLERVIDVPPALVWRAWTEPQLLMQWWTPRPWKTVACDIDLQPGGIFHTVMQSPEGEKFPYTGCYLEIVKNRRLVWTFLLGPGYRPAVWDHPVPVFVRSSTSCRKARVRAIRQWPCTWTRKAAISMRRWGLPTAGAPASISWSPV